MLMDAKEMVLAFWGNHNWSINPIISNIKALATLFRCVEFDYIPRALNVQAHMLSYVFFY